MILRERMKRIIFFVCLLILVLPPICAGNTNFILLPSDLWWKAPQIPEIRVKAVNSTSAITCDTLKIEFSTDKNVYLGGMSQLVSLNANDSTVLSFSFPLTPGFYKCKISDGGKEIKTFNIGYDPEKIISPYDAQLDFDEFWNKAKIELSKVAPEFKISEEKDKSDKIRKVYKVKMKSYGNEEIQGYLTVPVKAGKYPVILYYMGYGSKPWYPHPESNPEFIEFVLSTRGQGLMESTNKYGDWITYGLDSINNYYYKGAFMDLVRAIDFIYQYPKVDKKKLFVEGGSQGGAFTLAACALDNRISAAAPYIPFLSDYLDYFQLVHWPRDPIFAKQKQLEMSDSQLYKNLSYFDIKNFAKNIKCPILMGIGLQDPVCPPHTNFSSYNLIKSPKQFIIYPNKGHDVEHPDWEIHRLDFFKQNMK